ncbi:AraC family transcriptional regulator [Mameliella sediminis]|uniref:AraC family transcriptional regulator n=1 Tax=Mameliella sediminis TaxID=2836866 RepID=UPI001C452AD8|nr:AraC family transcriptional regulator [Mameliella sediminis]MBV7393236.1 AraC family transcriptional regulator [Mameliella sediminis]
MPSVTAAFAIAMTRAAGLSLSPDGKVLSGTHVIHQLTPKPDGQFGDQGFFDLISRIEALHPDRNGLISAYAEAIRLDDLGVLGLAMKTAPTLRASMIRMVRYFRLLTDTAIYRLDETGPVPALVIQGCTESHPALTLRNECAFAGFLRNARGFVRDPLVPAGVTFRHAPTGDPKDYSQLFGCPVSFGAERDAILFPPEALDLPNRLGDVAVSDFLTGHLEQQLEPLVRQSSLRAEVAQRLRDTLSSGTPQAAALARDMGLSERTFFRRLAEEGTTYRDVLRDVQIRMAQELLDSSGCSLAEIAFLTGFAEQSTFGRAFKRSVGQAPAQYRARKTGTTTGLALVAGPAQRLAGRADTAGAATA